MKEIHDHKTNAANEELTIEVTDEPGAGGANHRYEVTGFDTSGNQSRTNSSGYSANFSRLLVLFQNGPIKENGVNGVTQEALLAIVIDRLRSFQAGPYSCKENSVALTHIETGLLWLQKRTHDQMRRSVEGTHQK